MVTEKLSDFSYYTSFIGLHNRTNGQVIAVLGLPFYESDYRYQQHIIGVFTTIINVFAAVFAGVLALSYLSVISLIRPLNLLAERMRDTNLNNPSTVEPLEYTSRDEIGTLVREYNRMLSKLDESLDALKSKEKELAWREMAQQVAHEIKNPLTPMRLKIQHMQRMENPEPAQLKRGLQSMLAQIEILDSIVTSFRDVAKMPVLNEEVFDVAQTLRQVVELYQGESEEMSLSADIPADGIPIVFDEQVMQRTLTNLIKNAAEAVAADVIPVVSVSLIPLHPNRILIEVADNGVGIPDEVHHRIFLPHYTTKTGGSGLGLALAKRSIEHFGGSIWFQTELHIGTSFFIELPVAGNR